MKSAYSFVFQRNYMIYVVRNARSRRNNFCFFVNLLQSFMIYPSRCSRKLPCSPRGTVGIHQSGITFSVTAGRLIGCFRILFAILPRSLAPFLAVAGVIFSRILLNLIRVLSVPLRLIFTRADDASFRGNKAGRVVPTNAGNAGIEPGCSLRLGFLSRNNKRPVS